MFFFTRNNDFQIKPGTIEHVYCAILSKDFDTALNLLERIDSPRAKWCFCLIGILKGYIEIYPTYFQIRNFLEIDLDCFVKNEKIEFVEQILGALDLLVTINQETYKYVARVMFENRLYKSCREYLEKSKAIFYNDPELHFLFAKYYIKTREYDKADYHLDECLNILPDYYPARSLQREIARYLV